MKYNTGGWSLIAVGRLNKALDRQYNFDGDVMTLRQYLSRLNHIEKRITNAMCLFNRRRYNRMSDTREQDAYEEGLKNKRLYWVGDVQVPKLVFDAVEVTHE